MKKNRTYAGDWDEYVSHWEKYAKLEPTNKGRTDLVYPGDEWGSEAEWDAYADTYLRPFLPAGGVAVEIGPGSGKYTLRVVEKAASVICFDVSRKFMDLARQRLAAHAGRLRFELLELSNCYEIRDVLEAAGLRGGVDLFFSVDSMQHVEFHTLIAYWINAALSLKMGGHMAMTVATCTTEAGFTRLLDEVGWCYGGTRPSHQFYILSRDIVTYSLERLGFEVVRLDEGRDINFVARKVREEQFKVQEVR